LNYLSGRDYHAAVVETIIKLELHDMVDIQKQHYGASIEERNYFQGWLMP